MRRFDGICPHREVLVGILKDLTGEVRQLLLFNKEQLG